ncbi:MAG: hypothetical protein U0359_26715 [Byssovorax sp.]
MSHDPKRDPGGAGHPPDDLPELDDEMRAALAEAGMDAESAPPDPPAEGDPEGAEPPRESAPREGEVLDEVDVRELLRSALAPPPGAVAPDLLRGVQRKLRHRSRGKFYGDGWSTARAPRSTYLVTSLLMLILIALVFFILVPWGGGALP